MIMRHHEAGRLAELVINRIKGNKRRHQQRCLMSKDERTEELERRRWRKRMLNGFLLEEADESDNDSNIQTEEDGFRDAYANLLPLDSTGQSYVEILSGRKRLIRIISLEFRDLTNQERTDVIRKTQLYNEIHNK
jgi:hypothetical protein